MRDSLDFDNDDLEGGNKPPAYDAPRSSNNRDASPLPAPIPKKPSSQLPRESLDGETIFAVGEEGDRSDDDDEDYGEMHGDERQKLTGPST